MPAGFRVVSIRSRVFENHAGQFGGDALIVTGSAQQFCHIRQVYFAMLPDGHCQCFTGGIHAGDNTLWPNRPLGKHICLGLEIFILVQILQRAEQIIGAVIIEQAGIFLVVDQTVFCSKRIVGIIQLCLRCLDILVREVIQLLVDQLVDDLPQFHHASHTAFGVVGQFNLCHDGVLAVVDFTIHHGIAEVLHIGVCRQGPALRFRLCNVRHLRSSFQILPFQLLHRLTELVCQICTFYRDDRSFFFAILCVFSGQFAQNHLRVVRKVAVDGDSIFRLSQLYPSGFMVYGAVAFLQKDDVTDNIGARIGAECVVWQSDCSQQIRTLRNMLPGSRILTVQRITAGDKCHNTAGPHLVDGFRKEIIVDAEVQLIIRFVVDFVIAKRYVADH